MPDSKSIPVLRMPYPVVWECVGERVKAVERGKYKMQWFALKRVQVSSTTLAMIVFQNSILKLKGAF